VTTVWGSRFFSEPGEDAKAFTRDRTDRRLLVPDLVATRVHAAALHRAGLLDTDELARMRAAIDELLQEAERGEFLFDEDDEDVHVAVERLLTERLGPLGAKIHAGRSRNDLVATDLRLWVKHAALDLVGRVRALASALVDRAEQHAADPMPGYTHLQRAQPVTLGHHLLAHAFPLVRDAVRLERAAAAADVSSLGAAALAGSTLGVDPEQAAADLGMSRAFDNSIDAVADRDFALEFLAACLSTAIHLSRLGEDVMLWSSDEFGFARVDDAFATGSSIMPQKRNPDVAELARAQAGRVLGDLVTLATVLKGLPLAYDRDLQQDKPAVFDALDALAPALDAMRGMVATLGFDTERMRAAVGGGFLLATDLAEVLVTRGVPFREAHARVGRIVAKLDADGRTFDDVKAHEWQTFDPDLPENTSELLRSEARIERRGTPGGPSQTSIGEQIVSIRARLSPRTTG
jgi:argininosuccinate lyase